MSLNITAEQLKTVASTYGLNIHDPKVVKELTAEFDYLTRRAAAEGDRDLQRGKVAGLLDRAAQKTAERLGVRQPMPRIQSGGNDYRERYLSRLSPEQREAVERWQTEKESPAEAARQQAHLRKQFLDEVNMRAVDRGRGNMVLDDRLRNIRAKYKERGLSDLSISPQDVGQDDETLLGNLDKKKAVKSGAYKPLFRFGGDGSVEAADRPNDHREQGHRLPGSMSRGGK